MKILSSDRSELMEVTSIEDRAGAIFVRGKVFGSMPMNAVLTPQEARKGLRTGQARKGQRTGQARNARADHAHARPLQRHRRTSGAAGASWTSTCSPPSMRCLPNAASRARPSGCTCRNRR